MLKTLSLALMLTALVGLAQTPPPANIYAAGVSYNNSAAPAVAGTGLYARLLADTGTYAFTVLDALPVSVKPFQVTTNIAAGIAQKLPLSLGKLSVYVPTAAGISFSGSNTGWSWSTGALLHIPIGNGWFVGPNVRTLKSSVSGGSGYQVIAGVLIGWGK